MLQALLASSGAFHKYQSSKPLLADCTMHSTFCKMEWHLQEYVRIFRKPQLCVLLVHEHSWEWATSLNNRYSNGAKYCYTYSKKSWQNSYSHCLFAAVERLYHLDFVDTTSNAITCGVCWYWVTGNIVSQIFLDSKAALCTYKQNCPACMLTCAFQPHISCFHKHHQLIETSVPYGWLQILLVPVTC